MSCLDQWRVERGSSTMRSEPWECCPAHLHMWTWGGGVSCEHMHTGTCGGLVTLGGSAGLAELVELLQYPLQPTQYTLQQAAPLMVAMPTQQNKHTTALLKINIIIGMMKIKLSKKKVLCHVIAVNLVQKIFIKTHIDNQGLTPYLGQWQVRVESSCRCPCLEERSVLGAA